MATTLNSEDILKAAQAMTKDERLKLIAAIACLPQAVDEPLPTATALADDITSQEVMAVAQQFIDQHKTLLRRLAE